MARNAGSVTLEVRRHSYTKKEAEGRGQGSNLSRAGVELARRVGATMGSFDYVLTSDQPRTVETALAMGFAVDATADMGGGLVEAATMEKGEHHAQWDWGSEAFVRYAELVARDGPTAAIGRHQVKLWRAVVNRLPSGGRGLVIAHGGVIEPGLVGLRPEAAHRSWGAALGHLEGARLAYADTRVVRVQLIRMAEAG